VKSKRKNHLDINVAFRYIKTEFFSRIAYKVTKEFLTDFDLNQVVSFRALEFWISLFQMQINVVVKSTLSDLVDQMLFERQNLFKIFLLYFAGS